ncbi:alpha/beta fold hydrolase [Acinetobacter ursingii]|uniref:alpha/beta fold hydrolase n=3 Tax=Acinetobacter ursingii TaxID=108980 RepID=UPI0012505B56|nr:alpha/beta hydrolase [Acinetobacter ursingii]MCU4351914.1 alpha/beta hydrolase [Acinetobacter ursingii]
MMGQKRITEYKNEGLVFDVKDQGPLDGEVIVLLHGFPMTNICWDKITSILNEQGYRTIAPNQRGYTNTAYPKSIWAYSMSKLVDDIYILVQLIDKPKVYLAGHDWGALVAWGFAVKYPDRLHHLITVSVPTSAAFVKSLFTSDQLARVYYMGLFQIPRLPELFVKYKYPVFKSMLMGTGLSSDEVEWINDQVLKPGFLTGSLNWYRAMPFTLPFDLIRKIHVSTTFIWGEKDASVNRCSAENAALSVSAQYQFIPLPQATHWIPLQHPQEIAEIILNVSSNHS